MFVLFIFRRDLRIKDNLALNEAIKYSKENNCELILAFTFTKIQIKSNEYFSHNAFRFMIESLIELNESSLQGKLSFFEKETFYKDIANIKAIFYNKDYTPYARKRDAQIVRYCKSKNIHCCTKQDYTLHKINTILNGKGDPYRVFTHFYKNAIKNFKIIEEVNNSDNFLENVVKKGTIKQFNKTSYFKLAFDKNKTIANEVIGKGGRNNGLKILELVSSGKFKKYKTTRDEPSHKNSTTLLSAFLKFGCIGIREAFRVVEQKHGIEHDLIKQFYWKDFYANITYNFSQVLEGMVDANSSNKSFDTKFDKIKWKNNEDYFTKWCKGETGFPIVDAGMRQLNETGYMHNRLRMITASFLIKDLHIDWKKGEKYFASKLIDYDPASNNGGWQWVNGSGTDAAPYFRIFNPWTQQKKFDPNCLYIRKWIHELKDVTNSDIHDWQNKHKEYTKETEYFAPIVEHDKQREITINELYKFS